jgi:glycosyltransferase involved in cell wall biosynthesis
VIFAQNHPLGRLGIAWQISEFHGWGVFGLNVALSATKNHNQAIQLLHQPGIDAAKFPQLQGVLQEWSKHQTHYQSSNSRIFHSDATVLHSLGNDFAFTSNKHWGKRNVGFIFFENTAFSARGLQRAQELDLILTGSRWNSQLLAHAGLKKVAYVMQGVDMGRFESITPKVRTPKDRFVIFSGGKLEFRKGQDIALAAFKVFNQKYPDSVLMTAWHNPWPAISRDLTNSPYGFGVPNIVNNQIDVAQWCARSGLPASAFINVGATPNAQMPGIYAKADVALFPNRAEGGTNLVAMEAMAAGVPCILSANTGHLDLIAPDNCYALNKQAPYTNSTHQDWGQSNIEEIVATLEHAYHHREQLAQVGKNGRAFIGQFTWDNQTRQLFDFCANIY